MGGCLADIYWEFLPQCFLFHKNLNFSDLKWANANLTVILPLWWPCKHSAYHEGNGEMINRRAESSSGRFLLRNATGGILVSRGSILPLCNMIGRIHTSTMPNALWNSQELWKWWIFLHWMGYVIFRVYLRKKIINTTIKTVVFPDVPNNQIVHANQVHFFPYQLYNEPVLKRQKKCRLSRQTRLNQINYLNTKKFLMLVRWENQKRTDWFNRKEMPRRQTAFESRREKDCGQTPRAKRDPSWQWTGKWALKLKMARKWTLPTTGELGRGPWAPDGKPTWFPDFSSVRPWAETSTLKTWKDKSVSFKFVNTKSNREAIDICRPK